MSLLPLVTDDRKDIFIVDCSENFSFIPSHYIVAEYYGFTLDVRVSVRPSVNGFSPNLVCALILCRSGLGLLMGKF